MASPLSQYVLSLRQMAQQRNDSLMETRSENMSSITVHIHIVMLNIPFV